MMTNKNGQNELWSEDDTMRCMRYLNDQRIMREVNNDGMQYDVTGNEDGTYTHRFAWEPSKITKRGGMFESTPDQTKNDGWIYPNPLDDCPLPSIHTTRLYKWQKRFVFRLPPPFRNIFFKVVVTGANKD